MNDAENKIENKIALFMRMTVYETWSNFRSAVFNKKNSISKMNLALFHENNTVFDMYFEMKILRILDEHTAILT